MSKPPSKPAASAPAPAKGAAKPSADAKADKAKPDAALLDRDGSEDDAEAIVAAPARTGLRRLIPASVLGWAVIASLALLTIGGAGAAAYLFTGESKSAAAPSNIVGPAQVINGRMLVVAGQTIRLQAIDAPPAELICRDGGWEYKCGADSRKALEQLVGSRPVDCEPLSTDNGMVHATCYSDQGVDVAAALVGAGWAVADLRRSSKYLPQQSKAQDENRGLWRNNFAYPEQWRLAAQGVR